jgi:hypothetical protein
LTTFAISTTTICVFCGNLRTSEEVNWKDVSIL